MPKKFVEVIKLIQKQTAGYIVPSVTKISEKKDPYQVLISCILSLRTLDKTTFQASERLFKVADSPFAMVKLKSCILEKIIYPVGFYRVKSKVILDLSKKLVRDYAGRLPADREKLLKFKGVGRKTANLVLGLGFRIPAICVDTHVHRITNRLGWVKTKTPEETEVALGKIIPRRWWIDLKTVLVAFGQNLCKPVSPVCSSCSVQKFCKKVNVKKSR